jgi:membrane protein YqaA with SNARE-associated domain
MMVALKLHEKIQKHVKRLEQFADRPWYPLLIALLAALDSFLVIIPSDGILIASCMLVPKRWFIFGLSISIGSTIGAVLLGALVQTKGLPWILEYYPGVVQTDMWTWTEKFFDEYGLLLVFGIGASPLTQQPVIILAGLASTPLYILGAILFVGRILKYSLMAYLGSHSPKLLKKLWGIKDELKDAGVKIE